MTGAHLGAMLVVVAAGFEGLAQACLKSAAHAPRRINHWLLSGIALFVIDASLYTGALQLLDISVAYPISALSYVAVILASRWLLAETIGRWRWLGATLIILGVAIAVPQT